MEALSWLCGLMDLGKLPQLNLLPGTQSPSKDTPLWERRHSVCPLQTAPGAVVTAKQAELCFLSPLLLPECSWANEDLACDLDVPPMAPPLKT